MNKDPIILQNRNLVKASTVKTPDGGSANQRFAFDQSASRQQTKQVSTDPKINPAGKGRFEGQYAPYGDHANLYTYAKPDARHANRIRARKSSAPQWAQKAMPR